MKLQSFAVSTALVVAAFASPATVSAIECTEAQLESLNSVDGAAVEKACPSLFSEGQNAIDPTNMESFTADALKAIAPCKEAACLTELQKFVEVVPDCSVLGLNVRATYSASVKLCEAFSTGDVTVAKATEIFGDVAKNLSNAIENVLTNEGSDATGSVGGTELPTVTTEAPVSETSSASTAGDAAVPSPASSPASTPAPTTSGSSTTTVAGVLVFATATVASSLLL